MTECYQNLCQNSKQCFPQSCQNKTRWKPQRSRYDNQRRECSKQRGRFNRWLKHSLCLAEYLMKMQGRKFSSSLILRKNMEKKKAKSLPRKFRIDIDKELFDGLLDTTTFHFAYSKIHIIFIISKS